MCQNMHHHVQFLVTAALFKSFMVMFMHRQHLLNIIGADHGLV